MLCTLNMKNFFEEIANNNDQWFSETIGEHNGSSVNIRVMNDFAATVHTHDAADETFIVLSGTVLIDTPESTITISQGQSYSVKPGIEHRARVKGARRWGAMGQTLSLFAFTVLSRISN